MSWWDCASTGDLDSTHGCVHGDHCYVEQSKKERIPQLQYFQVCRCVGTSCVHAQSTNYHGADKDPCLLRTMCWVKCWYYRRSYCIRINCRKIIRALCGHCLAISGNSTRATVVASILMCHVWLLLAHDPKRNDSIVLETSSFIFSHFFSLFGLGNYKCSVNIRR